MTTKLFANYRWESVVRNVETCIGSVSFKAVLV